MRLKTGKNQQIPVNNQNGKFLRRQHIPRLEHLNADRECPPSRILILSVAHCNKNEEMLLVYMLCGLTSSGGYAAGRRCAQPRTSARLELHPRNDVSCSCGRHSG